MASRWFRQEPRQRDPAQRFEPGGGPVRRGIREDDLLFHDEKAAEPSLAYLLSRLRHEDGFPEPIGVFRRWRPRGMTTNSIGRSPCLRRNGAAAIWSPCSFPAKPGRCHDHLPLLRPREHRRCRRLRGLREFAQRNGLCPATGLERSLLRDRVDKLISRRLGPSAPARPWARSCGGCTRIRWAVPSS